ncbi:hypothetical protein BVRB_002860 [Beta vulgaris subsp. vulgaris]|uniref:Uncharacterized protein n=1 Tax=Beta vulgaris subsp. vulgaris TaxID=3555 RepID=A0A0J8B8B5_BETVV|nr:hypothetical protein BVRB_002860 [Beta vulgaris subsp. vulgaris]
MPARDSCGVAVLLLLPPRVRCKLSCLDATNIFPLLLVGALSLCPEASKLHPLFVVVRFVAPNVVTVVVHQVVISLSLSSCTVILVLFIIIRCCCYFVVVVVVVAKEL